MPPKAYITASYGGITRIRFMGRRQYLPLSLLAQAPLVFLFVTIKIRRRRHDASDKNQKLTPYGGMIRIRFPGSKLNDFLSARCTDSPLTNTILPLPEKSKPKRGAARILPKYAPAWAFQNVSEKASPRQGRLRRA